VIARASTRAGGDREIRGKGNGLKGRDETSLSQEKKDLVFRLRLLYDEREGGELLVSCQSSGN
jgi:hypothetical protein